MNHFTVLTHDLVATRDFYIGVLGLSEGYRPPLGFPGAWLYSGEQAVLHVIAGRPLPKEAAGVLDHMAFSARDLASVTAVLKRRGNAQLHPVPQIRVYIYGVCACGGLGTWYLD